MRGEFKRPVPKCISDVLGKRTLVLHALAEEIAEGSKRRIFWDVIQSTL